MVFYFRTFKIDEGITFGVTDKNRWLDDDNFFLDSPKNWDLQKLLFNDTSFQKNLVQNAKNPNKNSNNYDIVEDDAWPR